MEKTKSNGKAPASFGREYKCAKCGVVGFFGERYQSGHLYRQSQCSTCRGKKDTKALPMNVNHLHKLSLNLTETRELYALAYPNDKQKRSWLRMAHRLVIKLGTRLEWDVDVEARLTNAGIIPGSGVAPYR